MMNTRKFGAALEELRERLQWAIDSFEILRVLLPLVPDEKWRRIEEAKDQYSGFFEPTVHAHISQLFVIITLITEKKPKKNESIYKLLNNIDTGLNWLQASQRLN